MNPKENSARLKAILTAFSIPNSAVVAVGGVSKTFVSRLLSETDDMVASDDFWRRIEQALPRLIEQRRGQVFEVKATDVEKLEVLSMLPSKKS